MLGGGLLRALAANRIEAATPLHARRSVGRIPNRKSPGVFPSPSSRIEVQCGVNEDIFSFVTHAHSAVLSLHLPRLKELVKVYEPARRRGIDSCALVPITKSYNLLVTKVDFRFRRERQSDVIARISEITARPVN